MKVKAVRKGSNERNENKIAKPKADKSNVKIVPKVKVRKPRTTGTIQYLLSPEIIKTISNMYENGSADHEVAKAVGLNEGTVRWHKSRNPDISMSVKKGRDVADNRVEISLFKRACGYTVREETWEPMIVRVPGKAPVLWNKELVITKVVKKEIAPDVMAAHLWLRNRKTADWSKKLEADSLSPTIQNNITNNIVNNTVKPEEITDEHKNRVRDNLRIIQRYGDLASVPVQN